MSGYEEIEREDRRQGRIALACWLAFIALAVGIALSQHSGANHHGAGAMVQCADGWWSHSGGIQGACSWHGGEK